MPLLLILFVDVGFKIGGKTKIKYLVLQIHYVHPLKGTYSNLRLCFLYRTLTQDAG